MVVALVLVLVQGSVAPGHGPGVNAPTRAGFDARTFDPLVVEGIRSLVYPGAALVVGTRDSILFAKGYGRFTWSARSAAVRVDSTLWDLASLTKVVATTPALMLLVERGKVDLDAPVARYLPDFAAPETAVITVRHLLTHTSGLRGTLPLRDAPDSVAALRMVLSTTPIAAPGARVLYSDLNAILLGEIVRRVGGAALDEFVAREVYAPLGLSQEILFRPSRRIERRTAPTGIWRGHAIAGVVNDPNAAKLGGVAGHAGAFGTAMGVARFAQFMLREGSPVLQPETVRRFIAIAVPARRGTSARTLGWEALPTGEDVSSAGRLLGPHTYGHTGWTGTSLWIDPDRGLFVVLLTNRAYAQAGGARGTFTVMKEVRGRVADAAARAADARGR